MTPARVNVDDVRHVAGLARLGLNDERLHELAKDLSSILQHMEVLARVDTRGVQEYGSHTESMRLRADKGSSVPLDEPPESFAPQMREGFFIVPRLDTHEDVE